VRWEGKEEKEKEAEKKRQYPEKDLRTCFGTEKDQKQNIIE